MSAQEIAGIITTVLATLAQHRSLSQRLARLEAKVSAIAHAVGAKADGEEHNELRERVAVLESVKARR